MDDDEESIALGLSHNVQLHGVSAGAVMPSPARALVAPFGDSRHCSTCQKIRNFRATDGA
jgi:hypothetical protein